MKKMMVFLKPYWFYVGIALLFLFVELGVELVQPLLMAKLFSISQQIFRHIWGPGSPFPVPTARMHCRLL